jgi:hypothetical protein
MAAERQASAHGRTARVPSAPCSSPGKHELTPDAGANRRHPPGTVPYRAAFTRAIVSRTAQRRRRRLADRRRGSRPSRSRATVSSSAAFTVIWRHVSEEAPGSGSWQRTSSVDHVRRLLGFIFPGLGERGAGKRYRAERHGNVRSRVSSVRKASWSRTESARADGSFSSPTTWVEDNEVEDSRGIHSMSSKRSSFVGNRLHEIYSGARSCTPRIVMSGNLIENHREATAYGILLKDIDELLIERTRFCNRRHLRRQHAPGRGSRGHRPWEPPDGKRHHPRAPE